ncbi:unnamed protein product [Caenorhabditis angaria]|uniref:W02B3.4-like N-terminal domain-containing protein n=1 Tax=Caenorhabditis angaria TaxID=860376 RepID=A0A9P1MXX2_9PELO|nr:unnamed protein product [Caenorhabditis angaria]
MKNRTTEIVWLVSNCATPNRRMEIVRNMEKIGIKMKMRQDIRLFLVLLIFYFLSFFIHKTTQVSKAPTVVLMKNPRSIDMSGNESQNDNEKCLKIENLQNNLDFPVLILDKEFLEKIENGSCEQIRKIEVGVDEKFVQNRGFLQDPRFKFVYFENSTEKDFLYLKTEQRTVIPKNFDVRQLGNVILPKNIPIFLGILKFINKNYHSSCNCEGYNFCYSDPQNYLSVGRKFNCTSLQVLKNLGILNTSQNFVDTSKLSRDPKNVIFVSATSDDHYRYTRNSIQSIRKHLPNQKYILYKIGLDQSNSKKLLEEFDNIEIRQFNFSNYPSFVANIKEYRWKSLIIDEVLQEYPNVWWIDAHVFLKSGVLTNTIYEERAENNVTSDILLSIPTYHSNFAVLHTTLLEYFPTSSIPLLKSEKSGAQLGTGFMYFARTRQTLEMLKWWTLCALDSKCMAPDGAKLTCDFSGGKYNVQANCFRYDQSVLNILLLNKFQDHINYFSDHGFVSTDFV